MAMPERSRMNEVEPRKSPVHNRQSAALFYLLSVLLFPVTLLGYLLWVGKLMGSGRHSGVSGTAQGPLSARAFMHNLGTRPDEPAHRLLLVVPNLSPMAVQLSIWPLLLAHRVSGYVPTAFRYPFAGEIPKQYESSARQTFFDAVVERYLADHPQLVILGAGFDTRAWRLPKTTQVRAFEVDTPQTQAIKRAMVQQAGLDATGITFVAADFEQEDWFSKLVAAGFDRQRPALFLWEGVLMYLEREAVSATLRKIAGCAPGSMIAFDYFTTEALTSSALYWRYARYATKKAGEPLTFGLDSTPPARERLADFLHTCGLELIEQQTLGQESNGQRAWGGFATAIVK